MKYLIGLILLPTVSSVFFGAGDCGCDTCCPNPGPCPPQAACPAQSCPATFQSSCSCGGSYGQAPRAICPPRYIILQSSSAGISSFGAYNNAPVGQESSSYSSTSPTPVPREESSSYSSTSSTPSYSSPTPSYSSTSSTPSYSSPTPSYSSTSPTYSSPTPSYSSISPTYSSPAPSHTNVSPSPFSHEEPFYGENIAPKAVPHAPSPPTESDYPEVFKAASGPPYVGTSTVATPTNPPYSYNARGYGSKIKTFDVTSRCPSVELLRFIEDAIVENDVAESKRKVSKSLNNVFSSEDGKPINVICAGSKISYRLAADVSCEYTKGSVTCVAYKQT